MNGLWKIFQIFNINKKMIIRKLDFFFYFLLFEILCQNYKPGIAVRLWIMSSPLEIIVIVIRNMKAITA